VWQSTTEGGRTQVTGWGALFLSPAGQRTGEREAIMVGQEWGEEETSCETGVARGACG